MTSPYPFPLPFFLQTALPLPLLRWQNERIKLSTNNNMQVVLLTSPFPLIHDLVVNPAVLSDSPWLDLKLVTQLYVPSTPAQVNVSCQF